MMHAAAGGKRLVDYYIDEALGSIREIYLYSNDEMHRVEDTLSFEDWLKAEL